MKKSHLTLAALVLMALPCVLLKGNLPLETDTVSPECVNPITGENPCLKNMKANPGDKAKSYKPLNSVSSVIPANIPKANPMNGMSTAMEFPQGSKGSLEKCWEHAQRNVNTWKKWLEAKMAPRKMVDEKKAPALFFP